MPEQKPVEVYQLRFFLKGVSPLVWRRLLMTSNSSIADLHYAIQIAMGWDDYHLNRFNIWGKDYGVYHDGGINFSDNPKEVYLQDFQFRIHEKFVYEYNFYEAWEHEIRLEKIVPFDSQKMYPCCIGGHYAAPPEDCSGAEAFMRLRDHYSVWRIEEKLLEAIERYKKDKDWGSLRETVEELKYWFFCHQLDRRKINRQLHHYFHSEKNQLTIEEVQNED